MQQLWLMTYLTLSAKGLHSIETMSCSTAWLGPLSLRSQAAGSPGPSPCHQASFSLFPSFCLLWHSSQNCCVPEDLAALSQDGPGTHWRHFQAKPGTRGCIPACGLSLWEALQKWLGTFPRGNVLLGPFLTKSRAGMEWSGAAGVCLRWGYATFLDSETLEGEMGKQADISQIIPLISLLQSRR